MKAQDMIMGIMSLKLLEIMNLERSKYHLDHFLGMLLMRINQNGLIFLDVI